MPKKSFLKRYISLCRAYMNKPEKRHLAEAAELGRELMRTDTLPEEIGEIQENAIESLVNEFPNMTLREKGSQLSAPLMEMLMAYGLAFRALFEDRDRKEKALRKSEAGLTEAQRIAHLGSWEWAPESGELLCSEETYRIFGFSRENFMTRVGGSKKTSQN